MAFTRGEKKLVAVCALALAIPLGVAAFIGHINATPIIAATPPVKPPQPNGYDLYVRASNAIKPTNPPVDAILEIKTVTNPKVRAQRYSLKRKEAWLRQNRTGFALFEEAQKAESLGPLTYSLKQSSAVRKMARYKITESNAHWMRGEHNAALQSGLDIVQMGYDFPRGGAAINFLVGKSLNSMSRCTTSDTIEHLDANQARVGARRIEKLLATRWTLQQTLIEDKGRFQQEWLATFATPDWRTEKLAYRAHPIVNRPLSWRERWHAQTVSKRQIMADIDGLYERILSVANQPYGIKSAPPRSPDNPFLEWQQGMLESLRINQALNLTADRVLLLQLALRAYQLEHGAPPPNLPALVPAYIEAVPADPFGKGEPLRYKSDGKNYTLWSIGPDGKDDGGKPISRVKREKRYADEREKLPRIWSDSPGDYVAGKNH